MDYAGWLRVSSERAETSGSLTNNDVDGDCFGVTLDERMAASFRKVEL